MAAAALILVPAGLALGSFLTVVAHRLPRGEAFATGRSRCPSCGTTIAAYDNVPVLSWVALRGRCRHCRTRISVRYPLTELGLAALFVATVAVLGTDDVGELGLGLAFCALLVAITLTDLERRIIPNRILALGALVGIAILALDDPAALPGRLAAAAAAGGFMFLIAFIQPRGMGMGDVKLAAVMGLYLGRAVAAALAIGFAAGGMLGLFLLARHGSGARKQAVPFGPFLALGGVLALWFGEAIVGSYLDSISG